MKKILLVLLIVFLGFVALIAYRIIPTYQDPAHEVKLVQITCDPETEKIEFQAITKTVDDRVSEVKRLESEKEEMAKKGLYVLSGTTTEEEIQRGGIDSKLVSIECHIDKNTYKIEITHKDSKHDRINNYNGGIAKVTIRSGKELKIGIPMFHGSGEIQEKQPFSLKRSISYFLVKGAGLKELIVCSEKRYTRCVKHDLDQHFELFNGHPFSNLSGTSLSAKHWSLTDRVIHALLK